MKIIIEEIFYKQFLEKIIIKKIILNSKCEKIFKKLFGFNLNKNNKFQISSIKSHE